MALNRSHEIGNLEDLNGSPDLRINVKIGLLLKHISFYHIWAWWPFSSKGLKLISYLYRFFSTE